MSGIKKLFEKIKMKPMFYYFLLVTLIFLPKVINLPSTSFRDALVVAIGLDMENEELLASILMSVPEPTQNITENTKIISAKGESLGICLQNISIEIGRSILLGQSRFVVINEELAKNRNIADELDKLVRTNKLRNTVPFVVCKDKTYDLLKAGTKLEKSTGIKLSDIISYEGYNSSVTINSNLDNFYKGYYSPVKSSYTTYITLTNTPGLGIETEDSSSGGGSSGSSGGSSSGGSSGGGASGGEESSGGEKSGEEKPGTIVSNYGDCALFKNGKMVSILKKEEVLGLNWISESNPNVLNIILDNITTQGLKNASIIFDVISKDNKQKAFYVNGIPIISYEVDINMDLDEIIDNGMKRNKLTLANIFMDEVITDAINDSIKQEVALGLNVLRKYDADILGIYDQFMSADKKKTLELIKRLGSVEEFLKKVQIQISVNARLL